MCQKEMQNMNLLVISIDSLLLYKNYYFQVYLGNYVHKIANIQMADYLDKNLFGD